MARTAIIKLFPLQFGEDVGSGGEADEDSERGRTPGHRINMTLRTGLVLLSLFLSVLIGLTLAGRGREDGRDVPDGRGPRIGLSLGTLQEERWQRDRGRFVARAAELGAEVLVQSGTARRPGSSRTSNRS